MALDSIAVQFNLKRRDEVYHLFKCGRFDYGHLVHRCRINEQKICR